MIIKSSNITINVSDLDKSIQFYEGLGLTLANRWGNYYAQITSPGVTIGLHPTDKTHLVGNSGNISIGFSIDRIEDAKAQLDQLKIAYRERTEEGGQFLHFEDPDGTACYYIHSQW